MVTAPIHIDHWGVAITTTEISKEKATVVVRTSIKNETDRMQSIRLNTQLTDQSLKPAGNNSLTIELPANEVKEIAQTITVNNPRFWSPETPITYKAQIHLMKGGAAIDNTSEAFGIRSISWDVKNGFRLNGKKVILNGGCVHHDNGCLGAAAYDRAETRKVELLKSAGFNAVRTSHNPPSEAFLNACDRFQFLRFLPEFKFC